VDALRHTPGCVTSKRFLDFTGALTIALFSLPVLLLVALGTRFFSGGPVLFKQSRCGLYGAPFTLYKIRTLDTLGRPTAVGKILRQTSIDELPQLWNVLKGDMSLVGPRPLLAEYATRFSTFQMRRHEVLPGITGWAQIRGRNGVSWNEKFAMDVWYVDNRTLWLDLSILVRTFRRLFFPSGIDQDGRVGMEEFLGSGEAKR
jgi:sugar transferase EpsL